MQFFYAQHKIFALIFYLEKKESLKNANVAAKVTFYDGTSSLAPPFFFAPLLREEPDFQLVSEIL